MNKAAKAQIIAEIKALEAQLRAAGVSTMCYAPELVHLQTPAALRSTLAWAKGTLEFVKADK